jgi:DNA-binding IclR family transcriptional regulator
MVQLSKDLVEIVNLSMPFPADVLRAYSKTGIVFTSGDLAKEAGIPRSTAKYYVRRMIDLHMISKVPYRKKYQKYANAPNFSAWLQDLIRLAIRPLEESQS